MIRCKGFLKPKGRIHSFESFSTQDGPGIRCVIFMQGCLSRCIYCHNPDTWDMDKGELIDAETIFERIQRCLPYIEFSKGGVTISGGEPLLQPDFLIEFLSLCRKHSIHSAVDTSSFYPDDVIDDRKIDAIINLTDLFIVDIKAANGILHRRITSKELEQTISFINKIEAREKVYWIRYVLIPGLNDSTENIKEIKEIVVKLRHCEKFEFLPYHTLGSHKWKCLGLKYPLEGVRAAKVEDLRKADAGLNFNKKAESVLEKIRT